MADDDLERTHEPTEKRKAQMREEGKVPRSRELDKTLLLISAAFIFFMMGDYFLQLLQNFFKACFMFDHNDLLYFSAFKEKIFSAMFSVILHFIPFFAALFLVPLLSPWLTRSFVFSAKVFRFQMDRLNLLKGIGRMFSMHGVIELIKALGKVCVVFSAGAFVLWLKFDAILMLDQFEGKYAIAHALDIVAIAFFWLTFGLILIVLVDVPYQWFAFAKASKMSLKEIRDEMKETNVNPEIKGRMRQIQQQLARSRMMVAIPKAQVVVTNPTHYAIALQYDDKKMAAPMVVAKGRGLVAERIREIAKSHDVTIFSAPPLARALYYSVDLGQAIPAGLYVAVAKVLAYVYQLRHFNLGFSSLPQPLDAAGLPIPEELRRDEELMDE